MKLKNVILTLTTIVLLTYSSIVAAQSADSIGKKYYAYAHVFSKDGSTEYISSVFCWVYNPPQKLATYPNDSLTAWVKAFFKEHIPTTKLKGCACKFEIEGTDKFYTAEDAVRYWNLEIKECNDQNIDIVIATFPACKQ
jgi:hypothetical protein